VCSAETRPRLLEVGCEAREAGESEDGGEDGVDSVGMVVVLGLLDFMEGFLCVV
jgi:hypothetical protein